MRLVTLPPLKQNRDINTLLIECVSAECPFGKISYIDNNKKEQHYSLIGLSTFFDDKAFEKVIIHSGILLYPLSLICGILQESIRIGKKVFLEGQLPDFRYNWVDFPKLVNCQPQMRNQYRAYDLMEFDFQCLDNQVYQVSSDYQLIETKKYFPKKPVLTSFTKNHFSSAPYVIINLTPGNGYKVLIKQLQKNFNINCLSVYSLYNEFDFLKYRFLFPEHMYPLLQLKNPIILIIDDISIFNLNFREWNDRHNKKNVIIDFKGSLIID